MACQVDGIVNGVQSSFGIKSSKAIDSQRLAITVSLLHPYPSTDWLVTPVTINRRLCN